MSCLKNSASSAAVRAGGVVNVSDVFIFDSNLLSLIMSLFFSTVTDAGTFLTSLPDENGNHYTEMSYTAHEKGSVKSYG